MTRGTLLTVEEQAKVDVLHEQGLSKQATSKALNRSRKSVTTYLHHPETYERPGRASLAKKITPQDAGALIREVWRGHFTSSDLKARFNLPVRARRVRQILNENHSTFFKKLKRMPPLTKKHKQDRIVWAREHHNWTPLQWSEIVFSDEKRFRLDGPDGFNYYWHHIGHQETILSRQHGNGGGVMIWAAFSDRGTTKLAFVSGNQTAIKYVETLRNFLLPSLEENHYGAYVFHQDNAAIHTARYTKDWFVSRNINVMTWPARSPDLNPIENLQSMLARHNYANGKQFSSVDELKSALAAEWDKIGWNECYPLLRSMTKRCVNVLERGEMNCGY